MTEKRDTIVVVLAIDDEPLNNELVERVFHSHENVKLLTANSGESAMDLLASNTVDLILVDQSMPSMTGVEFVRQARSRGVKSVFAMVTAYPEMKEVIEAWEEGLVRYIIPKPWRTADLVQTLDRALARLS